MPFDYRTRQDVLSLLGFPSYQDYLRSPLWKSIRDRVLAQGRKCRCCPEAASEIHHREYTLAVLSGSTTHGLIPLCSNCHKLAEFDVCGLKTPLSGANSKVDLLSSLDSIPTPEPASSRKQGGKRSNLVVAPPGGSRRPKGKRKTKKSMILAKIPKELLD